MATMPPKRTHSQASLLQLLHLPNEILGKIVLSIDNSKTSLEMMRTCKRIHALFDNNTRTGQRVWQSIRNKEGWPDPSVIGMSDYKFIRAIYGRGCHKCHDHPRLRTPIWEFKGMRLCKQCFRRCTIRDYELVSLGISKSCFDHLPYFECAFNDNWIYRSYLKQDISEDTPTVEEACRSRHYTRQLIDFIELVEACRADIKKNRMDQLLLQRKSRGTDVRSFMTEQLPDLHEALYRHLNVYNAAVKQTSPFTARAKALLKGKLTTEFTAKLPILIEETIRLYARELIPDGHTLRPLKRLGIPFVLETAEYLDMKNHMIERKLIPRKCDLMTAFTELAASTTHYNNCRLYCSRCCYCRSVGTDVATLRHHFRYSRCEKHFLGTFNPRVGVCR